MTRLTLSSLLLAAALPAGASSVPEPGDASLWSRTQEAAGEWLDRSREAAQQAWRDTRELLGQSEGQDFGQVWDRLLPRLEDALALTERREGLPESSWLGEDKVSNQASINALLDEAVAILSSSDLQRHRETIRRLQGAIAEANEDIAKLRQRRVSAPSDSLVRRTAKDYERAIEARRADIERYQEELDGVEREFARELRTLGLDLDDEQIETLLATVVGDNLVELGIVYDNVKAVTSELERLLEESAEDLPSARRYYGMYVILLRTLHHLHVQTEQAIVDQYVPQIDAIIARAEALSAEAAALQRQAPEKAELLAANLEAQRLTVTAAGVYRRHLLEQARQVADTRKQLEQDIAAAWNTYETVRVSGELVALMRSSGSLLEGLLDRQVPALRPFQNLEMKREFERLTAQLRTASL